MKGFTTFLAVLIIALSASPAQAAPVSDPQISQWVEVARGFWGASPDCPGGITISSAEVNPNPQVWAVATLFGCEITLDPSFYPRPTNIGVDWWNAVMCHVVTHEYGHLLGHNHETTGIMMPEIDPRGVRGCPQYDNPSETYFNSPPVPPVSDSLKKRVTKCDKYISHKKYKRLKKYKKWKKYKKHSKCRIYILL